MLPGAWLMARRKEGAAWLLPSLLAMAGNLTNSWLQEHLLAPFTVLTLMAAALAIPLGWSLLRQEGWRCLRWGVGVTCSIRCIYW